MVSTGVIIAAGAGTRLADKSNVPKPLRKVLGVPLLKRIVICAAKGGLTRIVVVVGFQKEKIIQYIEKTKWPIDVEWVENKNWKKSNGISVLAASQVVKEDFVLLMSDHIFDPKTLAKLRETKLNPLAAILAVDYKVRQIFDKDDATKVQVENGKIVAIEKNLVQYNAIDTGMFLLSPEIFTALESAIKDGDCSLSDGIRQISEQDKMGVMDIEEGYWQDVDTKPALKHAEKVLLNACRKPTDGIVSRNLNRHISIFISSYLVKTPLSANQFTIFVLFLGFLTGYLASLGTYVSFAIAGVLFQLTSILDGVDGEMSKLRYTQSKFGEWLDTICDNISYVVFFVGTVVGLYKSGYPYIHILGPVALFGLSALLFVMFFYILKFSNSGSLLAVQSDFADKKSEAWWSGILIKCYPVIKRDFFALFFMFLALLGKPEWVVFLLGLATHIAWMVIVWTKFIVKPVTETGKSS